MITQISQGSGGGGVDTDEKSKVSSNDTTAGYLNGKLVAGTNITFTENNDGGNETLTIAAAGGVTGFTGSQNTASPNNTVNASRLLVDAASTNADAVVQPKGTGSLLAQLPDNLTSGGNKRGINSVDLQTSRTSATHVAAAPYSVISGGRNNWMQSYSDNSFIGGGTGNRTQNLYCAIAGGSNNNASLSYAFIGAGSNNTADAGFAAICAGTSNFNQGGYGFIGAGQANSITGNYDVVCGGQSNTASATHATIAGGQSNTANNAHATVGGGQGNTASQSHATVAGGISNTASGTFSAIIGGSTNTASGAYSVASGFRADADKYGMRSHASGQFAAVGDAQLQEMVMRRVTTDNTQVELSADGDGTSTHQLGIVNDTTVAFDILVVARRTDADNESAAWNVTGCIDNNNNVCALVGTPTVTSLGDDSAGAWLLSVAAEDAAGKRLKILATGQTGKTIRWVAHVRSVKVTG